MVIRKLKDLRNGDTISIDEYKSIVKSSPAKSKSKTIRPTSIKSCQKSIPSADINQSPVRSKFGSVVTYVDGIKFHSKWEAERYCHLLIQEKLGEISNLELQVPFKIAVNDEVVTTYVADFTYLEKNKLIVEDAKGFLTPEYIIKKKLMKAVLGIEVFETRKPQKNRPKYKRR